ncbi:MAG TPA: hypothetical protein VGI64_20840 [Streptosporangiaceae bacterium]
MIRRGFWLTLGAALGVTGYRRIGRLAGSLRLTGQHMSGRGSSGRSARRRGTVGQFVRDMRDGMDEYLEQHPRGWSPTLDGQQARTRAALGEAGPRTHPHAQHPEDGR